jgi:hypothetical protein
VAADSRQDAGDLGGSRQDAGKAADRASLVTIISIPPNAPPAALAPVVRWPQSVVMMMGETRKKRTPVTQKAKMEGGGGGGSSSDVPAGAAAATLAAASDSIIMHRSASRGRVARSRIVPIVMSDQRNQGFLHDEETPSTSKEP